MRMKTQFSLLDEQSRRDFVSQAAQGFLGLSVLPLIGGRALAQDPVQDGPIPLGPATAKNVIYLFMQGGMSQMDTFDPKPGTENQGPVEAIKTAADGVLVSQHFPNLARHMDKVAVISSMHTTQGAHAQGQYYMHTTYERSSKPSRPSSRSLSATTAVCWERSPTAISGAESCTASHLTHRSPES